MRRATVSISAAAAALLLAFGLPASGSPAPFSAQPVGPPGDGWQLTTLRGKPAAEFTIMEGDRGKVLRANARAAAAGLTYAAPVEQPLRQIEWTWNIAGHPDGTDMTRREGDDFAARIYLTFDRDSRDLPFGTRMKIRLARLLYGQEVPAAAICYVWDPSLPVETAMPNAYSDTVMMLVATSGPADGDWRSLIRDYAADYRRLFGTEAPPLTSVIVASDTDDTGSETTAWFGDVVLR